MRHRLGWLASLTLAAAPGSGQSVLVSPDAYLKASNTDAFDNFGAAIDASGSTVVVGAYGEASSAMTVNGDQSLNDAPGTGAAYVFVRSGSTWTQQAYLKSSFFFGGGTFGREVAIDGDRIAVGATGTLGGSVYLFERSGTSWSEVDRVSRSSGALFGHAVALSGTTLLVGAYGHDDSAFDQDSGAAYVYVESGSDWISEAFLQSPDPERLDWFGYSVSLSGDTLAVGAPMEDGGSSGMGGNPADNSATNSGAAFVFVRSGTIWTQQAYVKASNTGVGDEFGRSVALCGDTLVVSAWREDSVAKGVGGDESDDTFLDAGAAYVFVRSGTTWSQQAYLKASNTEINDRFGSWVDLDGDRLVVSAVFEDGSTAGVNGDQADNNAGNAGALYLFERAGTTWAQLAYLKASNPDTFDELSRAAISGDVLVCATEKEDSAATGIDGDASDNSATSAGAAYAFELQSLPASSVYCTAKLNSDGCVPTVAVPAGPPLVIDASLVPANKNGLFFYGLSGALAAPFFGGTLCVTPPLRRTFIQSSSGAGPCGGAYAFDLDAWIAGGNDPLLVPGTQLNGQFWYRDPLDSFGVGLTDATELFVTP